MSNKNEELNIDILNAQAGAPEADEAVNTTQEPIDPTLNVEEAVVESASDNVGFDNSEIASAIMQRDPARAREIARARLAQMTPAQIAALRAAKAARMAENADRLAKVAEETAQMPGSDVVISTYSSNNGASRKKSRRGISYESKQAFTGFMFVLPWFIGFLLFFAAPCFKSLQFAFSKVDMWNNYKCTWNGIENFKDILTKGATYVQALVDTLTDLAVNVPVILIFSLFVAVLLNRKFVGRGLVRAIFFLPVIVTTGVVMTTFNSTSDASAVMEGDVGNGVLFEVANAAEFLGELGLNETLTEYMSMVADRIFNVVWDSGVQILLFLAALQGISPSLYEASNVEGATAWETFWLITFPNVAPIILVNIVYTIVDTFGDTSNPVLREIDKYINDTFIYSRAAAASWIFFVVILLIIGVIFGIFKLLGKSND